MIISNQQVNSVIKAYGISGKKNAAAARSGSIWRSDSLEISSRARELSNIHKTISALPEVRSELVEKIKRSMEKGEYVVSSEAVVHRILVRSLVDRIMGAE